MKRVNIRDAFAVETNAGQEDLEDSDSNEVLVLAVRGGELTVVVPNGVSDAGAVEQAEWIRGVLRLENERVLSFEIHADATGAFFEDEPAPLHRRQPPGSAGGPRTALARDVMTTDPVVAMPSMPVREAADLLTFHRISGLPVTDDDGRLAGILSEVDIIEKRGETVADLMSGAVISVQATDRMEEVAAVMSRKRVKRVPVLEGGRLVGIISRSDVVRWVAR